jgi:hypothetical protein
MTICSHPLAVQLIIGIMADSAQLAAMMRPGVSTVSPDAPANEANTSAASVASMIAPPITQIPKMQSSDGFIIYASKS